MVVLACQGRRKLAVVELLRRQGRGSMCRHVLACQGRRKLAVTEERLRRQGRGSMCRHVLAGQGRRTETAVVEVTARTTREREPGQSKRPPGLPQGSTEKAGSRRAAATTTRMPKPCAVGLLARPGSTERKLAVAESLRRRGSLQSGRSPCWRAVVSRWVLTACVLGASKRV